MNINELIDDLLKADGDMDLEELYTHCQIITKHNGISQEELDKAWNNNEKVKEMKK